MFYKIILVGVGGFFGSISRYWMSGWVHNLPEKPMFPYGTLAVNILGCFLIGLLNGIFETRQIFNPEMRLLIFVGFLGGLTTFSAFGYELFSFLRDGQYLSITLNASLSVVLGLFAVWLGHALSKLI
jgi:CrcB protein